MNRWLASFAAYSPALIIGVGFSIHSAINDQRIWNVVFVGLTLSVVALAAVTAVVIKEQQ